MPSDSLKVTLAKSSDGNVHQPYRGDLATVWIEYARRVLQQDSC